MARRKRKYLVSFERYFNGRRYIGYSLSGVSKRKALELKTKIQNSGKLARIIKVKRGYIVYRG